MEPTIKVGQVVYVKPVSPTGGRPRVGDIVVFHPPNGADPATPVCGDPHQGGGYAEACDDPTSTESNETFVKRVVAGPGDVITIVNGHVIRDGVREKDPYIEPCGTDPSCNFPKPITIPPGDYFVLGDNRGASDDSRFWGPVPLLWILGRVVGGTH